MKTKVIIMMSLFISLFLTGCEKELVEVPGEVPGQLPPEGKPSDLPDGYFEVTFSAGYGGGAVSYTHRRCRRRLRCRSRWSPYH